MYIMDVLNKCRQENHPMTRAGIYSAGKKHGFLEGKDDKGRWNFNQKKFIEWLKKSNENPPEGWVTLNELSKQLEISISNCYLLIKNKNSGAKRFGNVPGGKGGLIYVDPERIKEIISNRENKHKYNWEDETND